MKLRIAKKVITRYTIGLHNVNKGLRGHVYVGISGSGPIAHLNYDRCLSGRINFRKALKIYNRWLRNKKRVWRGIEDLFGLPWIQF